MQYKKTDIHDGDHTYVYAEYIKKYQEGGFFAVDNALELLDKGERVYSEFSYFEKRKEEL